MPDFGQGCLLLHGRLCPPAIPTNPGADEIDGMICSDHYNDRDVARFYDIENGWAEDFDFCSDLAKGRRAILDLGCGTGMLAAALARRADCLVVGVDPAAAMLALAKQRYGGASVSWVLDDARTVRLNRRFDLVLLTGHAFQVFLTPDDQAAALTTIAAHLAPNGRFILTRAAPLPKPGRDGRPINRDGSSSTRGSAGSPRGTTCRKTRPRALSRIELTTRSSGRAGFTHPSRKSRFDRANSFLYSSKRPV